jgi:trk system potassium uptake protein TrkH
MELILEQIRRGTASPAQVLVAGYLAVILAGALLLLLPFANASGRAISFVDALFMSTSAVSITGLAVKDLATDFTVFGQLVLLLLIQIGGLGYMTSATVLALFVGKRIGLRDRLMIQEALNVLTMEGLVRLTRAILLMTIAFEALGAVILTYAFSASMPPLQALYHGVFHSVSGFNNAGFALSSTSLMEHAHDPIVLLTISTLAIVGGLGFIVFSDLYKYLYREVLRISIHTKLVLATTALLIAVPAALFYLFEAVNPRSLAGLPEWRRPLASYFQVVMTRTAGFNMVDIGALNAVTLYMFILLMFIGGSPNGTAGGIKTTTFATMMIALWAMIRGHEDVTAFHRRLSPSIVARAFQLALMAFLLTTGVTLAILLLENRIFLNTLFEVMSAFGTVGLSMGDGGVLSYSALFSEPAKLLIIVTMFIGRIGPLTIGAALIQPQHMRYRLPEGKCLIG